MDSEYEELQQALHACRERLAEGIWKEQALPQGWRLQQREAAAEPGEAACWKEEALFWRERCARLEGSLSWKLTRPLRLLQMAWESLRGFGVRKTLERIGKYVRRAP